MGIDIYWRLADSVHPLLSECVFRAAIGKASLKPVLKLLADSEELSSDEVAHAFQAIKTFCRDMNREIRWKEYQVAAFTCTFNQIQATLYAAGLAKAAGCRTIVGGFMAYGDNGRELLANDCIDSVLAGPGEELLYEWLKSGAKPGFYEARRQCPPKFPDYTLASGVKSATLIFEASRGCEFNGCAFCSQNRTSGRIILPEEVFLPALAQLDKLTDIQNIEFADTSFPVEIAEMLAMSGIFGRQKNITHIFAETRCLDSREMRIFARAGFTNLQIGVESLTDNILLKIHKGCNLAQIVCCLRESWNTNIKVDYNIILDLPGVKSEDITQMLNYIPRFVHLPPPTAVVKFQLQRGSPIFRNPLKFGISQIRPSRIYENLNRTQPFFYYDFTSSEILPDALIEKAREAFLLWSKKFTYRVPLFQVKFSGETACVNDARFEKKRKYELDEEEVRILKICRNPVSLQDIRKYAASDVVLKRLIQNDLLFSSQGFLTTLPVMSWGELPPQPERDPIDSWFWN